MTQDTYRLADTTVVEPLVNRWAVWSDLMSPVPASLHLVHYQMKILESYLADPEIHIKASQNPKFYGGRFVDVSANRAAEVRELLEAMKDRQSENIKLAAAVTEFSNYLDREAEGQSLEPFYEYVPEALRGYVELVYDYFNNPTVRLIESLLYESPYYRKDLQGLNIFQQERDNSRPFFLNTPRLRADRHVDWNVSFDDSKVDQLFDLDVNPQPIGYVRELLNSEAPEESQLLPLLSSEAVNGNVKWIGPGVRLRYFGHACVLIEWNGITVLTDPWIGVQSAAGGAEHFCYSDLPEKIDFAVVTHGHHDHFVLETLLRLRRRIECLVVPRTFGMLYADTSLRLLAKKLRFNTVIELDALDSIKLPDGEIIAVPFLGEHADLAHGKVGYVVRAGKEQILFAADSNCLDSNLYKHLKRVLGPIKTVFLGMECVGAPLSWMYGTFLPSKPQRNHDQSRRTKGCNAAAALSLLEALESDRVYVYAMGKEPWLQYSMGLGLSEDSHQVKESINLIMQARARGFVDASRPFCKCETHLMSN
jgi:L-ascorbate metabolism protein UlaG (beta-lactamase superfamily)